MISSRIADPYQIHTLYATLLHRHRVEQIQFLDSERSLTSTKSNLETVDKRQKVGRALRDIKRIVALARLEMAFLLLYCVPWS